MSFFRVIDWPIFCFLRLSDLTLPALDAVTATDTLAGVFYGCLVILAVLTFTESDKLAEIQTAIRIHTTTFYNV